jgi:hypothetical protein
MEQAHFSEIRSKIIKHLEGAVNTVQVAMAWFTSGELFNALLGCLEKGVKVDLILLDNAINYMDYAPDFNLFIKAGGNLRIADFRVGFMHHKFCIIDSRTVITGSYNWTYYAETRNVENVLITDNESVVDQFKSEFSRLTSELSVCNSCQRLTWDDIETIKDVNYEELNYEIERICEVQNKPVRRVYETRTEVVKTEIRLTAYSKYSIGIIVLDEQGVETFVPLINGGQKLPYSTDEMEFYMDSKNEKEFHCKFICGTPSNADDWMLIKEVDLLQIATGTSDENLPVKFSMRLEDNGSLRIDVSCAQSGERMTISVLKSDLVKYE